MPCAECSDPERDYYLLLCFDWEEQTLFCPRCRDLPIEYESQVELRFGWLLEERFTDGNIINVVNDYQKTNLTLYLIERLNYITNVNTQEGHKFSVGEFGYLVHILKKVYEHSDFGDKQLEDASELDEEIELLRDAYTTIVKLLEEVRTDFAVCIGRPDRGSDPRNALEEYDLIPTEYKLCHNRCLESLMCGREENEEDYNFVSENFRDFDRKGPEEIETLEDFGDCWYEIIQSLMFVASSDETVGDIYYTELPESVDIFQLEEFSERLDSIFTDEQHQHMKETSWLSAPKKAEVEKCGEDVFEDDWPEVKENIIIREDNLDAHPFLFQVKETQERMLPGSRRPREIEIPRLIYPRFWDQMLKFQIFPMLDNGDKRTGHEILTDLTRERGLQFERNIHEHLAEKGFESYHSAEISRHQQNEIDVLCVLDDQLVFIELKFLMPPLRMSTATGVEELNENFDYKVFKEDNGAYPSEPTGKPHPEKVGAWEELEPGDTFWSQTGPDESDREEQVFKEEWKDMSVEKLVVSNLVPSYVEKASVRFLTDLEFYQWVEHGEDVFYEIA